MKPETEKLLQRTFRFGVDTLIILLALPKNNVYSVITGQLAKASTSVGANYEEAQAAESKKDFIHKVGIVLKEIRERNYWLRILNELSPKGIPNPNLNGILNESFELRKIFSTIKLNASK